jgi:hypothetical protein
MLLERFSPHSSTRWYAAVILRIMKVRNTTLTRWASSVLVEAWGGESARGFAYHAGRTAKRQHRSARNY